MEDTLQTWPLPPTEQTISSSPTGIWAGISIMESPSSLKQPIFGADLKKKLFRGLSGLLPMPHVVAKAQSMMVDPNSNFDELASIIETDPEITLRVLKLANSAYYGLKNNVYSVHQACVMLGLRIIGEIIMAAGTSSLFSRSLEAYRMTPKGLWQHSLAVAIGSRKIAKVVRPELANEAFLSGLFHDVGKFILDDQIFSRNDSFKKFLGDDQSSHFKVEKQILGFDHSEIASELCRRWKFPLQVTNAVRHHHSAPQDLDNELTLILYTADNLSKRNDNGNGSGGQPHPIDDKVMEFLAMEENDLTHIMSTVNESVNQISAEIFSIN